MSFALPEVGVSEIISWALPFLLILVYKVAKHYGVDQKTATIGIAVVLWVLYMIFVTFLPETIQESIIGFVWGAIGFSKFIYDIVTVWDNKDRDKEVQPTPINDDTVVDPFQARS